MKIRFPFFFFNKTLHYEQHHIHAGKKQQYYDDKDSFIYKVANYLEQSIKIVVSSMLLPAQEKKMVSCYIFTCV